jgi:hypothetical protein
MKNLSFVEPQDGSQYGVHLRGGSYVTPVAHDLARTFLSAFPCSKDRSSNACAIGFGTGRRRWKVVPKGGGNTGAARESSELEG